MIKSLIIWNYLRIQSCQLILCLPLSISNLTKASALSFNLKRNLMTSLAWLNNLNITRRMNRKLIALLRTKERISLRIKISWMKHFLSLNKFILCKDKTWKRNICKLEKLRKRQKTTIWIKKWTKLSLLQNSKFIRFKRNIWMI